MAILSQSRQNILCSVFSVRLLQSHPERSIVIVSRNYQGFRKHHFPKCFTNNAVNSIAWKYRFSATFPPCFRLNILSLEGFFEVILSSASGLLTSGITEPPCPCWSCSHRMPWTSWGQFYLEKQRFVFISARAARVLKQQSRSWPGSHK